MVHKRHWYSTVAYFRAKQQHSPCYIWYMHKIHIDSGPTGSQIRLPEVGTSLKIHALKLLFEI